jgi:hypothetical protein
MINSDKSIDIFNNAQIYSKIATYINSPEHPSFLIPSQVIAALSLELYFKSLFYLEKKEDFKIKGRYSHDFCSLYNKLSNDSKEEIKNNFDIAIKNRDMKDVKKLEELTKTKISLDFCENLKIWSTIFTEVRYLYEEKAQKNMMFFPEFKNAVVARINKIMKK